MGVGMRMCCDCCCKGRRLDLAVSSLFGCVADTSSARPNRGPFRRLSILAEILVDHIGGLYSALVFFLVSLGHRHLLGIVQVPRPPNSRHDVRLEALANKYSQCLGSYATSALREGVLGNMGIVEHTASATLTPSCADTRVIHGSEVDGHYNTAGPKSQTESVAWVSNGAALSDVGH